MAFKNCTIIKINLCSSCISLAFYIIGMSTNSWITATAFLTNQIESDVNYGLFNGRIERHQLAATLRFSLYVTCEFAENFCIYSCQRFESERKDELQRILRGEELSPCEETSGNYRVTHSKYKTYKQYFNNSTNPNIIEQCLPASLWLSTVLFLTLSILLTVFAGAIEMINLHYNPVEPIFNIFGIYFWNGAAAICALLTLSIWGGLFNTFLTFNIAITDTLRQDLTFLSNGQAKVGYSLFMVLAGLLLNIFNAAILFLCRRIVNQKAESHSIAVVENNASLQFY